MQSPIVSVIIIEYNSLHEIKLSFASLVDSLKFLNSEIIVVSNSTYDNLQQDKIVSDFPGIKWLFNSENSGFASAMNNGLEKARGKYLAIVNPDVVVIDGFLPMIEFMELNPDAGAVGPKIIDFEDRIQDSCRSYVSLHNLLIRQIKRILFRKTSLLDNKFDYGVIQTVDWLAGAFIVVRREVYEATKGLNPAYFLYAEDMDWCTRIRLSGFEIVYFPEMTVRYSGSRSARKFNKYTLIFLKSHFIYWKQFGFFGGYPKRERKSYIN